MAFAAYFVFNEVVKGGVHVEVPDVVGLPVTQAAFVLAEEGLEMGTQKQVVNDRFPEYHVMLQRPASMKIVRSGRKVNLTISAGRQEIDAPNLLEKDLETALTELKALRLTEGALAYMPSDAAKGTVIAQDPAPSRSVAVGGEISLLVSDGPALKAILMP